MDSGTALDSAVDLDASAPPLIVPIDCRQHSCEGIEIMLQGGGDEILDDGDLELRLELGNCGTDSLPFAVPVIVRRTADPSRVEARSELVAGLRPNTQQVLRFRLEAGTWEDTMTDDEDCLVFDVDPEDQITECEREDDSVIAAYGIACVAF